MLAGRLGVRDVKSAVEPIGHEADQVVGPAGQISGLVGAEPVVQHLAFQLREHLHDEAQVIGHGYVPIVLQGVDTLENYRHVPVTDNLRFIVEVFSKLECEVLNDWFRSDEPTDLARWTDDLVSLVPDRLYRALDISNAETAR